jgi:hypothetical protein
MLWMESMAERVTDYFVCHHSGMPRLGQAEQALAAASGLIHALHGPRMPESPKSTFLGRDKELFRQA